MYNPSSKTWGAAEVKDNIPYLLVYKSTSCISRPPIFKVKNQISYHFGQNKWNSHQYKFPKLSIFSPWECIGKAEVWSYAVKFIKITIYELFDLLEKYFTIFGSKSHGI